MEKGMVCAPTGSSRSRRQALKKAVMPLTLPSPVRGQTVVDPMMCGLAGFGSMQLFLPKKNYHGYIDFHDGPRRRDTRHVA